MRNLVLGGSGMIGSHLCEHLLQKGETVVNLDLKVDFDLRQMSLDNFRGVDYVWFFAWDVGGAKYIMNHDNSFKLLNNNLKICANVFSFLKETQIPFMFASTQLVNTDNIYGLTKIVGEEYAKLMNGKIVRFWNVYGWEEPGEKSHVITDLVLQGLTKGEIQLMTNGEEERQFIHINDCVKNLFDVRSLNEKVIHFTNNKWIPVKEAAQIIAHKLNCKLILGDCKGYENKLDADETHKLLQFNTTLEKGIDNVIVKAREYLKIEQP
jgi:nucleoside-diphosphate-sugar epimerase